MNIHYCDKCNKLSKNKELKNGKCKCGNYTRYIGTCRECLNFEEIYNNNGLCIVSNKIIKGKRNGCKNFK